VTDHPFPQLEPDASARLAAAFDREGKIPHALDTLGPIRDRDVVLLGGEGRLAALLRDLGGRITTCPLAAIRALPAASADAVVSCWDGLDVPGTATEERFRALARTLRPAGRLLIVADYGRDDVDRLRPLDDPAEHYAALRRRDMWFADHDFKLHVVHGRWTFATIEEAAAFLIDAFAESGRGVAADLQHPRIAHKVVVYHRAFDKAGREHAAATVEQGPAGRAAPAGGPAGQATSGRTGSP
jgi:hypothetical protein